MEIPNILIVSDLHLSRGYYTPEADAEHGGHYSELEDFFADEAFFDFVAGHIAQGGRWRLILNGDVVDFLQVVDWPTDPQMLATLRERVMREGRDWKAWKANKSRYGLGTTAIETGWKLEQIAAGHPVFFMSLAYMLAQGHEVIIISGNHDIEWYWPQVQAQMRDLVRRAYRPQAIERRLAGQGARSGRRKSASRRGAALDDDALQRLRFYPRFYYIPDLLYVEHGCQYDVSNSFPDMFDPVLPADHTLPPEQQRIELPLGSFFVRYFFNLVEQSSPFADNIKPILRYLKWAVRRQPAWVVRMLLTQCQVAQVIWRRLSQIHRSRIEAQAHLAAKLAPAQSNDAYRSLDVDDPAACVLGLRRLETQLFKSRPPILYVEPRHWFNATSGFSLNVLYRAAKAIQGMLKQQGVNARYFVLGHDHNADVKPIPGSDAWYYNTGTWAFIEGEQDRFFRETRELTFVKIMPGAEQEAQLLRWNDSARRSERVILMTTSRTSGAGGKIWGVALLLGGLALLAMLVKKWRRKK